MVQLEDAFRDKSLSSVGIRVAENHNSFFIQKLGGTPRLQLTAGFFSNLAILMYKSLEGRKGNFTQPLIEKTEAECTDLL